MSEIKLKPVLRGGSNYYALGKLGNRLRELLCFTQ